MAICDGVLRGGERAVRVLYKSWRGVLALALVVGSGAAMPAADYSLLARAAPDFALRAFAGDNVRLSEHRGEVVLLSFWSSRCSTCGAQLAALNRTYLTYRSAGLAVYGISVEAAERSARDFADAHRVAFPMLFDPEEEVSRLYDVDRLPMVILVDRNGTIRDVQRDFGDRDQALYLRELRGLLNQ
jgi:peroxiredoxin